jgi:hypothetical protein
VIDAGQNLAAYVVQEGTRIGQATSLVPKVVEVDGGNGVERLLQCAQTVGDHQRPIAICVYRDPPRWKARPRARVDLARHAAPARHGVATRSLMNPIVIADASGVFEATRA